MKKALLAAVVSVSLAMGAYAVTKAQYRTFRFSDTELGVRCMNGSNPTTRKIGEILLVSCGDLEAK